MMQQVFGSGSMGVTSSLKSYSTNFPLTENPLSEGGIWTPGSTFSAGAATKTNMQSAGKAYSTMVSFDGTNFDDSLACLSGFGPDHQITCTISNSGGFSGFSLELEILLRADITSAHVFQYEVDCVWGDKEIDLVRGEGTLASPNAFTTLRTGTSGECAFNNGDQVRAKIQGTLITVDYKPFGSSFSNLFTYDTSGDSIKYSTGNPGIGAWNQTGSATFQPDFAWADFLAVGL